MKALTLQLSNFANAVAEGEILEVDAADELESVRAIEIAYLSLRTGQCLELQPAANAAPIEERKFSVVGSNKVSFPA